MFGKNISRKEVAMTCRNKDTIVREVLGVSVEISESEVHWRNFIRSLVKRGLHGVELVISDAHEDLKGALKAVLP